MISALIAFWIFAASLGHAKGADAATTRAPIRFVGKPIVVVWTKGTPRPEYPLYEVYFRLSRRLTLRQRLIVELNGLSNYDTNGFGYDDRNDGPSGSRCYAKGISNTDDYPASLKHMPHAVRVRVRFDAEHRSITAAAILRAQTRDDPSPGATLGRWYKQLGCRGG